MADEEQRSDATGDVPARLEATRQRLAEMSAAMDETKRRQDEIQRQQAALLDQLERLSRAMDEPG